MKTLVIYYSFEGNTELIAKTIAESCSAELLKLQPKEEPKTKGFMKYFWGGRQVMMKKKTQLLPMDKNPQDYDIIFIGTPVWAWNYSPSLAAFFDKVKLNGKKIAIFCCHAGGKAKALEKIAAKLSGNAILGMSDYVDPLRNKTEQNKEKARRWAQDMISK